MKSNKLHKVIISSLVMASVFAHTTRAYASEENFDVYYYKRVDIDESFLGNKKQSSEKSFEQDDYQAGNEIVSFFIEGDKAYSKSQNGNINLVRNSLVNTDQGTYYAGEDGTLEKGLKKIGDSHYYFGQNYLMVKNTWKVLENRLIAADENGRVSFPKNQSVNIEGISYKTDENGYLIQVLVEKEADDIEALEEDKSLNNSQDPMSPSYRTGLNADQLAYVINTAYPNNKLIKDNDPVLVDGFAQTLVDLENELGINPFFILGIINAENPILHGKFSNIVAKKNNLMSWTSYDNDPFNKSTMFNSYSAAVIHPARFLSKNYLDPNGKYYVDGSVKGVNKYYATDQNWHNNVNSGMKRLNEARLSLGY